MNKESNATIEGGTPFSPYPVSGKNNSEAGKMLINLYFIKVLFTVLVM